MKMKMDKDVRRLLYSIISLLALLTLLYVKMPFADLYENAVKENAHLVEEAASNKDMKFVDDVPAFMKKVITHYSYNNYIRVLTLEGNASFKSMIEMNNVIRIMQAVLSAIAEVEQPAVTEDEVNVIPEIDMQLTPVVSVPAALVMLYAMIYTAAKAIGLWVLAEFILMATKTRKKKQLV